METAESIAKAIISSVDECCDGKITTQQCSTVNRALWDKAGELGIHDQVDQILQAYNLAEMREALLEGK
jgi:hypothetical protein